MIHCRQCLLLIEAYWQAIGVLLEWEAWVQNVELLSPEVRRQAHEGHQEALLQVEQTRMALEQHQCDTAG